MYKLNTYENGNYTVDIFEDGTKVRYNNGENFSPLFAESADVKITDYCDLNCKYCHEKSTEDGLHGDLDLLYSIVKHNKPGTELALGGGNPLSHPELYTKLQRISKLGIILNMTVNQEHLLNVKYFELLISLLENKIITAVGISITDNVERVKEQLIKLHSITNNIVFHVIIGVNNLSVLDNLKTIKSNFKVLILGYKSFGRGTNYYNIRPTSIDNNIKHWYKYLAKYIGNDNIISFDNLAIVQLNVKRYFTKEEWNEFFMGNDGEYTFYIDLVNKQFAKSSTANTRFALLDNMQSMFRYLIEDANKYIYIPYTSSEILRLVYDLESDRLARDTLSV